MASSNEIGKAVYTILTGDATVAGLLSTKVYPLRAPQSTALPYAVYTPIMTAPSDTKDGVSPLDTVRVQVDVYDDNYDDATTVANAIRAAMDRYQGTAGGQAIQRIRFTGEVEDQDGEMQVFWKSQDYDIRLKRER